MTIEADYAPVTGLVNNDREYTFPWPAADPGDIYIYEVLTNGVFQLVRNQDYSIKFGSSPREMLNYRGTVSFNRAHGNDVVSVRIERNTYIDQTVDYKQLSAFNTRTIEYTLDKLTMIAQEIADRKCEVATAFPITQKVIFGSYWEVPARELNLALNKLTRIYFEIDQSGEDCRFNNAPEGKSA